MININKLMAYAILNGPQTWARRDTILRNPMDKARLRHCLEKELPSVPVMATVIAAGISG